MVEPIVYVAIAAMLGLAGIVGSVVREYIRHRVPRAPLSDARLDQLSRQLETLQQSVDTTSIEVERLGEGLRFTTKLLAERSPSVVASRQPERVVTPH